MTETDVLGWDASRMLTRLITAIQAELGLRAVRIDGLFEVLESVPFGDELRELAQIDRQRLLVTLRSLQADGWLYLHEENPHVSVAAKGLLLCGALRIPEGIGKAVRPRLGAIALA